MFKRILVPVDGSAVSMAGLQQALTFARDQQAKVRIVHIVDEAVLAEYPEVMAAGGDLIQTMIADGKKTLQNAVTLAQRRGIKAESVLYEKLLYPLADLILREAKKWRADIIVMGTHARTGVKHFFLGSEAENIARSSRLPVLLIHGTAAAKRKRASKNKS